MERPTFVYLKSADHAQTEEILVKSPRLFGITATVSIVVQPLDHPTLPSLQLIHTASLSFQCLRNSRPKPVIGVAPASFFASARPPSPMRVRFQPAARSEFASS
jgi:hypothetical protein